MFPGNHKFNVFPMWLDEDPNARASVRYAWGGSKVGRAIYRGRRSAVHTGSKSERIARDSFATVRSVDSRANLLSVDLQNGASVTYDPRRLQGVNVFREVEREFATGDRVQFITPNKTIGIANRDLGTIDSVQYGQITVQMDGKGKRSVAFDPREFRQFDHAPCYWHIRTQQIFKVQWSSSDEIRRGNLTERT
jgi:hypothetical protein